MPEMDAPDDGLAPETDLRYRLRFLERFTDEKFRSRDMAVDVAIAALNVRLNGMNEFRETLRDQATRFVTREEFLAGHSALDHNIGEAQIALSKWSARAEEAERYTASERASLDKRLESVNEFRDQLKDQASTFVTRKELDLMISLITADTRRLETATAAGVRLVDMNAAMERGSERLKMIETRSNNSEGRLWPLAIFFLFVNGALSWLIFNIHLLH
jgi:hypothetical protein